MHVDINWQQIGNGNLLFDHFLIMYNLCVFPCIIFIFVFHCTHVRMSYVLNSYLLTYLFTYCQGLPWAWRRQLCFFSFWRCARRQYSDAVSSRTTSWRQDDWQADIGWSASAL